MLDAAGWEHALAPRAVLSLVGAAPSAQYACLGEPAAPVVACQDLAPVTAVAAAADQSEAADPAIDEPAAVRAAVGHCPVADPALDEPAAVAVTVHQHNIADCVIVDTDTVHQANEE